MRIARAGSLGLLASALLGGPPLLGRAHALQLCEGVTAEVCREDVEADIKVVISNLQSSVPVESDRRNAVSDLQAAVLQAGLARLEIDDPDPSLLEEQICARAGKQDDRMLKKAARGVKNAEKIASSKFSTQAGFDTTRASLIALVTAILDAAGDNVDEVETEVGVVVQVLNANSRLLLADANLAAGKLGKAADLGQRAYDVVRDLANVPTCLDNQT